MNYCKQGPDWWPLNERMERPHLVADGDLIPLVFGTKREAEQFVNGQRVPTYPHSIYAKPIVWRK